MPVRRLLAIAALILAAAGASRADAPGADPAAEASEVRERSIGSFEELLAKYPETSMRAPVLLLLGDLYAERAKALYLAEVARHEEKAAAGEEWAPPTLDYEKAIRAFQEVAALGESFAGSVQALHALGVCYDEMGRTAEAEQVLTEAARLSSDPVLRAASLLRLGDLRFAGEDWEGALEAYASADESGADEGKEKLDYRIGWCHLKQGELAEARTRFTAALERSLRQDAGGRPEESLSEVLRSLALVQVQTDPFDLNGYASRFPEGACRRVALVEFGEALIDHDRPEVGEKALRKALRMDRNAADAPEIHDRIIEALSAQERKRDAGLEMEAFLDRYRPGTSWWTAWNPEGDRAAEVEGRVLRNCWNAGLLRFAAGTEEDLRAAAALFERYTDELGGTRDRSRALLFSAEARSRLGDWEGALVRYDAIAVGELPEEEREDALRGAVLAHQSLARDDGGFAAAALRYAEAYPEAEEAQKALLLAAEREEAAGHLPVAFSLCTRAGGSAAPALRAEAEARAARLAAAMDDRAAAEEWYLRASRSAEKEEDRRGFFERAGGCAFLLAGEREAAGRYEDAASSMARVFAAYRGTAAGFDALLREIACRARFDREESVSALADTLAALRPASEEARAGLTEAAAGAFESGRFPLAARLHEKAHQILPRAENLLGAGVAYESAGDPAQALERFEQGAAEAAGTPLAAEAYSRLGGRLDAGGAHERAALAFDRAFEEGGGRKVEFLTGAGSSYLAAGETGKAADRFARAVELYRADSAEDEKEELHAARAFLGLARAREKSWMDEVGRWRHGGSGKKAAALLKERMDLYQGALALHFEETNRTAALHAGATLELFGRTAFLREWEAGRAADPSILEPHFRDALLLFRAAGTEGVSRLHPYADLADTLIARGEGERHAAPAPEPGVDTEATEDSYGAALQAIEGADEKWGVAALLLQAQEEAGGGRGLRGRRTALALRAAVSAEEGARLLRASPEPAGLSGKELDLYRSLLEEKARAFEGKAAAWYRALPEADPDLAVNRPDPGGPGSPTPPKGETP